MTAGVVISMDGRGRFMDNIFIERLWRSIKYEEVHLKAYADGCEGAVRHQFLDELLQFSAPSSGDEQPDADGGVARRHGQNRGGGEGCGYAASLGQRKRVAHIPTAEAATSGLILEGQRQARLHLKFNDPWSHEWGPVHPALLRWLVGPQPRDNGPLIIGHEACHFEILARAGVGAGDEPNTGFPGIGVRFRPYDLAFDPPLATQIGCLRDPWFSSRVFSGASSLEFGQMENNLASKVGTSLLWNDVFIDQGRILFRGANSHRFASRCLAPRL